MHDVARLAGVSHQTVSRVINRSDKVRPQTRDRVLAAMRQLDYRPNALARALVTGRSNTLGIVTAATALYGPAATLLGFERAAHDAGYFVSVVSLKSLDREVVRRGVGHLQLLGVEGVVVIGASATGGQGLVDLPRDTPLVVIEAGEELGLPVAKVDQYQGARLATEHLMSAGHARVHHLAGPQDWHEARDRAAGWRDASLAVGADSSEPVYGDWSARSGYQAGRELLERPDVTAVFVGNDQMALGFLRLLRETGYDVPGDISVVGFDDVPDAEFFSPPLTTVRQDFGELGRRSLEMLVGQISGKQLVSSTTVPTELITRGSVAAPAAKRAERRGAG